MIARTFESLHTAHQGMRLDVWLIRRGCDQRTINRIATGRKWAYGSYRPSDRAALLTDSSPELTEMAAD
jgi:hypothetical protein